MPQLVVPKSCVSKTVQLCHFIVILSLSLSGSPRVLISQLKKQSSVEVGEEWQHFDFSPEESPGSSVLTYSYRVTCDQFYYGAQCSELCKPRDDKFGHYTCTQNGTKSCLDGWGGSYCDEGELSRDHLPDQYRSLRLF